MLRKLLTLTAILTSLSLSAYDFAVENSDGVTIYYNILNDSEVAVTHEYTSVPYSGSVKIPSEVAYNGTTYSVTAIGSYAFSNCYDLTSVEIGNSVTSIGYEAFYFCSGLTSVIIPNSVTSIGYEAFYYCSGLTSVTIPDSVTSIGSFAFYNCSGLTSVVIGKSVNHIDDEVFSHCRNLTSLTCKVTRPQDFFLGEDIFYHVNRNKCTLHVPQGCKNLYASVYQWKDFFNIEEFVDAEGGDINGDGGINVGDVTSLINEILDPTGIGAADVNGDGEVNVGDITAVVNLILGEE